MVDIYLCNDCNCMLTVNGQVTVIRYLTPLSSYIPIMIPGGSTACSGVIKRNGHTTLLPCWGVAKTGDEQQQRVLCCKKKRGSSQHALTHSLTHSSAHSPPDQHATSSQLTENVWKYQSSKCCTACLRAA